jgi:hypothetical protein
MLSPSQATTAESPPVLKPRRRRWIVALLVLLVPLAIGTGWRFGSSTGRAKRYFREEFSSGKRSIDVMFSRARFDPAVTGQALAELLEERTTDFGKWYAQTHGKLPKWIANRLPTPSNPAAVVNESIGALGYLGPAAAPAIPRLISIYQSSDLGLVGLKGPVVNSLGRIGSAATNAIIVLLPGLDPTNGFLQMPIAEALMRIDPKGDFLGTAWARLAQQPAYATLATRTTDWCLLSLDPPTNSQSKQPIATTQRPPPGRWMGLLILGLIPGEAERSVPVIRRSLDDENDVVRALAAVSLGMLGTKAAAALPELRRQLNDESGVARAGATNSIRDIEARQGR